MPGTVIVQLDVQAPRSHYKNIDLMLDRRSPCVFDSLDKQETRYI